MFQFGAANAPNFVPQEESQHWLLEEMVKVVHWLGEVARPPRILGDELKGSLPKNLDQLFESICMIQSEIGQGDIEFTLLEMPPKGAPNIPENFSALGDLKGKMLTTLVSDQEYLFLYSPGLFMQSDILLASIARELGRVALHQAKAPLPRDSDELSLYEARAELSAIALGMGAWIANGSYIFENSCCGGGCGIDLKSLSYGLSMPEACYALVLDALRKGIPRRKMAKILSPTQKSALKQSWKKSTDLSPKIQAGLEGKASAQLHS